jgi:alpha-methylacyl-CoA racemase
LGPLAGVRIIEIAAIGPAPFAAMMLADHGAEVVRVDRPGGTQGGAKIDESRDILARSRKSLVLDLKNPAAIEVFRDLCRGADGLIEGFRPGVMERLGLGPEVLLRDNPKLVYGRMTGWGQTGPYAQLAGHDINYIAIAGNLHGYGRAGEKPTPPINAVGDFGGGGMMLAFGMVAAILAARGGGPGQVIDCAMVEGAAVLGAMTWTLWGQDAWRDEAGVNLLDTGAPFYDTYETADGKFIALGAIEPQFYAEFRRRAGLDEDADFDAQMDEAQWPAQKAKLTSIFLSKTREEWCALLDGGNACFAPILSLQEAPLHPHNVARGAFAEIAGVAHPLPAPRYSVTTAALPEPPRPHGADAAVLLAGLGYDAGKIDQYRAAGAFGIGAEHG